MMRESMVREFVRRQCAAAAAGANGWVGEYPPCLAREYAGQLTDAELAAELARPPAGE